MTKDQLKANAETKRAAIANALSTGKDVSKQTAALDQIEKDINALTDSSTEDARQAIQARIVAIAV